MPDIYIVYGEAGEYSEREWWMVEAMSTEEQAQQRVLELEGLIRELFHAPHYAWTNRSLSWEEYWKHVVEARSALREHPRGDPFNKIDNRHNDAYYAYQKVPMGV